MTRNSRTQPTEMTSDDFRAALADLGLSQTAAAKRWGINLRTVQMWACGDRSIPSTMIALLRLERGEAQPIRDFLGRDDDRPEITRKVAS